MAWEDTGMGNTIFKTDDVMISFNPGLGMLSGFSMFAQDDHGGETAIIRYGPNGERGPYYILNGDHRNAYEAALANGWDAMLAYYESQKAAHRSSWSEDESPEAADAVDPVDGVVAG